MLFIDASSNFINLAAKYLGMTSNDVASQTLYFIFSEEDFRLWHFAYGPILIFDKKPAPMNIVALIVLKYVYELYLSFLSFAVLHRLPRRLENKVLVLHSLQNPLYVLERNLIVMWNEKALH